MASRFSEQLHDMQARHSFIGEVRVNGLMIGIEIVSNTETDKIGRRVGDRELARRIQAECFNRGLIIELGGRHGSAKSFLPPLSLLPNRWTPSAPS